MAVKNISDLPAISVPAPSVDLIPIYQGGVGHKATLKQYVDALAFTSVHPMVISTYIEQNTKNINTNIHGGLLQIASAQPLNNVSPINATGGVSRIAIVVNAGTDFIGTLTITGTSVNRQTGAETPSDTDNISVDSLSSNTSTTDSNGNNVWGLSDIYISNKWFKGSITITTTDLDLSNVNVYQIGYEQFNDAPVVKVLTFDSAFTVTSSLAYMDEYLYVVEKNGNDRWDVVKIAEHHLTVADSTADRGYRKRVGNIGKQINCTTDGVFMDVFFGPSTQQYFQDYVNKIWVNHTHTITVS